MRNNESNKRFAFVLEQPVYRHDIRVDLFLQRGNNNSK